MKQPLHGGVVVTISSSGHALGHPIAPEPLAETAAAILTTLVDMKQDAPWPATHLVSPIECFDNQLGIRLGGHRPAHHPAAVQVQDDSQVTPSTLCPDIGDVTAPDPVQRCCVELPIKDIGSSSAIKAAVASSKIFF